MFEGAKWFKVVENVTMLYRRMWNEIRALDMVFQTYLGVNGRMGVSFHPQLRSRLSAVVMELTKRVTVGRSMVLRMIILI
jgi:hypothetical protein